LLGISERTKMAIDEQRVRQSLHARLVATLGDDEAALLMDYLPPVGWADVATKRDVDALAVATKHDLDALAATTKHDLDALAATTKHDLDALRTEMSVLRSDLHAEIADLKSSLLMWLLPTIIGSVAVAVTLSRVV
jgi:hypothetical protein